MSSQTPEEAFEAFVRSDSFPCVGAKSALARDTITLVAAEAIDSARDDLDIHAALKRFGDELVFDTPLVQSFAVLFGGPRSLDEQGFEKALWDRLQSLHNLDVASGMTWVDDVARDPSSAHFSMSLAGQAYFVVGLHPGASRPARRFDYPAMIFNSHRQFEKLRADGRYQKMQAIIRQRDEALAGSINPMLDDFGKASEARQYSGRKVEPDWACPLAIKEAH